MGFIPVEFSSDDVPASEADFSFTLHFASSTAAVQFFEPRQFADAFADGDDLNVRDRIQYIRDRYNR
jgi:hypothetical protein